MPRRNQLSDREVDTLATRAMDAKHHAATACAYLGGRFPPDVAGCLTSQ